MSSTSSGFRALLVPIPFWRFFVSFFAATSACCFAATSASSARRDGRKYRSHLNGRVYNTVFRGKHFVDTFEDTIKEDFDDEEDDNDDDDEEVELDDCLILLFAPLLLLDDDGSTLDRCMFFTGPYANPPSTLGLRTRPRLDTDLLEGGRLDATAGDRHASRCFIW